MPTVQKTNFFHCKLCYVPINLKLSKRRSFKYQITATIFLNANAAQCFAHFGVCYLVGIFKDGVLANSFNEQIEAYTNERRLIHIFGNLSFRFELTANVRANNEIVLCF